MAASREEKMGEEHSCFYNKLCRDIYFLSHVPKCNKNKNENITLPAFYNLSIQTSLCIHRGLIPGAPRIPKSVDAQVFI